MLEPGDDSIGWLAQQGHVPLGYLHDEAKTKRTFPLIGGLRYAVPGDRAIWLEGGVVRAQGDTRRVIEQYAAAAGLEAATRRFQIAAAEAIVPGSGL